MDKINCNIIVCGPAIGKTYLAGHDNRFVDIDGMKADYKYDLYNLSQEEKEKGKLNRGATIREDSSEYAIDLLEKTIAENKIVLLSYNKKVIKYIIEKGYKYCLVYANKELREEYAERMKKRGNSPCFIDEMTSLENWENFYKTNISDSTPKYKVELKEGQYLSDIKGMFV